MIVNQTTGVGLTSSRPVQEQTGKVKPEAPGDSYSVLTSSGTEKEDSLELNTRRMIVSENLSASEAVIPDLAEAGNLMQMVKTQLEFDPAKAVGAQTGNLDALAARLLDNI